jgi:hypothetical protein
VVESSSLDKAYAYLPVLVVADLTVLTKEFLERAYNCFVLYIDDWRYEVVCAIVLLRERFMH